MKEGVKSLRIYISKDENLPGEEKVYREFDDKGRIILEVEFSEDSDDAISETSWTYDENGNEVEKLIEFGEGQSVKYINTYDDQNRLSSSKTIKDGQITEDHRVYEWNEDGSELTVTLKDGEGDTIGEELKFYNANNDLTEEQYYDEEGNMVEKYIYKYDADDRITEKIEEMGGFETRYVYEYQTDSHNRLTEMKVLDEEGDAHITRNEFHENGKKSFEERILPTGASEVFYFDEDEKVIQEEKFDKTKFKIQDSHYFYDEYGQLIRKHILSDGRYFRIDYEYELTGDGGEEE